MDQLHVTSTQAWTRLQAAVATLLTSNWQLSGLLSAGLGFILFRSWRAGRLTNLLHPVRSKLEASEPGLFKKYSTFHSMTTASGVTYPRIRVFYHAHAQIDKLPKDLPLLVFMHGLGGNATQFAPLLTSMINVAPCLAIDLPGCGLSDFKPDDASAYTTAAFAELLAAVIDQYRDKENNQQIVLIGHSMGCAISALLASATSEVRARLDVGYIIGLIAICPKAIPSTHETAMTKRLQSVPSFVFDVLRFFDRRGGLQSRSVTRMVGDDADVETRKLQQKYNAQSKSATLLRILNGTLRTDAGGQQTGWPGKEVWAGIKVPLFLVAGESDQVTSPQEVMQIATWLKSNDNASGGPTMMEVEPQPKIVVTDSHLDEEIASDVQGTAAHSGAIPSTLGEAQLAKYHVWSDQPPPHGIAENHRIIEDTSASPKHNIALKVTILPAPAAHGLLYSTDTVRILSGLIEGFLGRHIDERLGLGWQLQHLTTSGKWDVKNLAKWSKIDRCSEPIGGVFRAMKTMREVDDLHNPTRFVQEFGAKARPDGVATVVDISHESPVYDPKGLVEGGVEYHKFPTVSKLPPTADEVEQFIGLVDRLRQSDLCQRKQGETVGPTVGVHCHYGFNRTGFFIVCYLVERLGYKLADAIAEFAEKRAPGIKHDHFVNELYVRYAVKMDRRGTIVE